MFLVYIRLYTISNPVLSIVAPSASPADCIVAPKKVCERLDREFPDTKSFEHLLEDLCKDNVLHSILDPWTLALVIRLLYLQAVSWGWKVVLPEFLLYPQVPQSKLR